MKDSWKRTHLGWDRQIIFFVMSEKKVTKEVQPNQRLREVSLPKQNMANFLNFVKQNPSSPWLTRP